MSEHFQKAVKDADLISAWISGLLAAIITSYVASVAKPGIIDVLLALVAVGAIVGAFLLVARAKVEPDWKGGAIIFGGALSVLCLRLSSLLY